MPGQYRHSIDGLLRQCERTAKAGEELTSEAGAMMFMQDGIRMATTLDQTGRGGGRLVDKLLSAGKRMLSGDSFFVTIFFNESNQRRDVAFASPFPGKIQPIDLDEWQGELIAQKDSFLAAAKGVSIGIAFQRKLGVGLFGGEGFIMQRLVGDVHPDQDEDEAVGEEREIFPSPVHPVAALRRVVETTGGSMWSVVPGQVWLQSGHELTLSNKIGVSTRRRMTGVSIVPQPLESRAT